MSTTFTASDSKKIYKNDERPAGAELHGDAPIIDVEKSDIADTVMHLLKFFPEQWKSDENRFTHAPTGIGVKFGLTSVELIGQASGTIKFTSKEQRKIKGLLNSILAASWHKAALKASLGKITRYQKTSEFGAIWNESEIAKLKQNMQQQQNALSINPPLVSGTAGAMQNYPQSCSPVFGGGLAVTAEQLGVLKVPTA